MNTINTRYRNPPHKQALKLRPASFPAFICAVLLFLGGTFSALPAQANTAKATAKVTSSKASSKKNLSKKRSRPIYIRSMASKKERAALKERGISSGFGMRAVSRKNKRMHNGIDIPAPRNSKILAFNDGVVTFVGRKSAYGIVVIVKQIDGREALYAHMNKSAVAAGDKVRRGTHIGHVGRTGRATGYHLHFELIDGGKHLDPALHVWHSAELVLGPKDFDPTTASGKAKAAVQGTRVPAY